MTKATSADHQKKPLAEQKAAQQMWIYYKANKANLISNIRGHRESILAELRQRVSPDAAFAPYVCPAVVVPLVSTPL